MPMRDYENLKDIKIPAKQEAIMDIICDAWNECRRADCKNCPDKLADNGFRRLMECTALKYSRLLYEAGIAYTEEDVRNAYNDGYACGMEQGAEAERSKQG